MEVDRKIKRGRPRINAVPVNVRFPPEQLSALDQIIESDPSAPGRAEFIRRIVQAFAKSQERMSLGGRTISDSERNILVGKVSAASRIVEAFGAVEAAADILGSEQITSAQDLRALGVSEYDVFVLGDAIARARQVRRQTLSDLNAADAEYENNPAIYR
ncbi:hypothetical protein V8J38_16880 (plasmid) [Brevundimonas olei]|uniref:Ribbon-helix-helix protein CopG domain-containing protein n=1 Tax=Brevundimonas olei TaxID=657642 RepID=A0ABZ2INL5_9CAUL